MIGKRIQNYKILSLLGEGGMGIVYKAFDLKLERYTALKILNINSTRFSRIIERFRKEAKNQAKLNHPNIVSVYGFVEERDIMGIAMEFVEGQTLEQIIKLEGRLEPYYALNIMSQVLDGISYAHDQGFIHRDLKPSNIIIDLNGNVKIMDFGISKSIDEIETITQHNSRPGTLLYMSPEQLTGNEVTVKSDLYSLGITLYEMLTGEYPYEANTFYEVVDSHVNKAPANVSSVPNILDDVILKAMGKYFGNNFNSAIEFNDAIKSIISELQGESYNSEQIVHENVYEQKSNNSDRTKTPWFSKAGNFLLVVIFIGLAVYVYSVVKNFIKQNESKVETSSLSYTQDYSKNPNFIEQTDWQLTTINSNNDLNAVYFTDNLTGFVVGTKGTILKTTNSGQSWSEISPNHDTDFNSIVFNNGRIFCAGDNGTLMEYNLSFPKWRKVKIPIDEALFNIKFINDNIGFITCGNGVVLRSADGGLTWKKIFIGKKETLFSVSFSDEQTGFIVGWNGHIYKTDDQGLTWHSLSVHHSSYLKDILFVNQFLGFIVGSKGLLLRTEDGGNNWEKIFVNTSFGLYKVFFENNEDGIILNNRGEIFKTTDAGKNWQKNNIGETVVLNDIQKLETGKYIIVGNNGSIFFSKIKPN